MALLFDCPENPAPLWVKRGTWGVLIMLYSLLCWWAFSDSIQNWERVWVYRIAFLKGWITTIIISAIALIFSVMIAILAVIARRAHLLILRYSAILYVEIVRGLPLMVLILFGFYCIADKMRWYDRFSVGVLILSLFSGAYISEMIRGGIESISRSQWDSARAIGLTSLQTYRFVVFPQVLRQLLPSLAGQFASLIKDSSLLYIIGVSELTFAANQINSATYSAFEAFLPLGLAYLLLTLPVSLWTKCLERKAKYEN